MSTFISSRVGMAAICAALIGMNTAMAEQGDPMGVGEAAWLEHCAVCHGRDGSGGGVFVPMLRTQPPDITLLAQRNGGDFPENRVRSSVDGRRMPLAHGTTDMPIWGVRWQRAGESKVGVRSRIIDVVAYLRTLQK